MAPLASAHHERLDGSGYPYGWTGDRLTMPMRALAVADVYDALTSERPYRPAHSSERALEVLRSEAPRRLDSDAVGRSKRCWPARDTPLSRRTRRSPTRRRSASGRLRS